MTFNSTSNDFFSVALHMSSDESKQTTSSFLQSKQAIQTVTNRKTLKRSRQAAYQYSGSSQENDDGSDDFTAFPAIQWPGLDDSSSLSSSSLSDVESDSECESSHVEQPPAAKRRCRGLVRSLKTTQLSAMA